MIFKSVESSKQHPNTVQTSVENLNKLIKDSNFIELTEKVKDRGLTIDEQAILWKISIEASKVQETLQTTEVNPEILEEIQKIINKVKESDQICSDRKIPTAEFFNFNKKTTDRMFAIRTRHKTSKENQQ